MFNQSINQSSLLLLKKAEQLHGCKASLYASRPVYVVKKVFNYQPIMIHKTSVVNALHKTFQFTRTRFKVYTHTIVTRSEQRRSDRRLKTTSHLVGNKRESRV